MVLNSLEDVDALIDGSLEEDLYGTNEALLDCLLPNGIYFTLSVNRWATVQQAKQHIWEEAFNYPFFNKLPKQEQSALIIINSFGEREQITDENRLISTVQPFLSVLKIVEKTSKTGEKNVESQIGSLIGKQDFDSVGDEEVIEFRRKCKDYCQKIYDDKRSIKELSQQLATIHPPEFCEQTDALDQVTEVLGHDHKFMLEISHDQQNGQSGVHRLLVTPEQYPVNVIEDALRKQNQANPGFVYNKKDYVLKVVGREEYLLPDKNNKDCKLYQYKYIFRKIMKRENPRLVVLKQTSVITPLPAPRNATNGKSGPTPAAPPVPPRILTRRYLRDPGHAELLDIRDSFMLKVVGASRVNCTEECTVQLKVSIYHGIETICDMKETREVLVNENNVEFDEDLDFELGVRDLPRMSRLCLSLYVNNKPSKNKSKTLKLGTKNRRKKSTSTSADAYSDMDLAPLAWVNMCVFDYKARLRVGPVTLYMWPYDDYTMSSESLTNHLGTVINNPQSEAAIALQLEFLDYGHANRPIVYPSLQRLIACAAEELHDEHEYGTMGRFGLGEEEARQHLSDLLEHRDPLQSLHEQEKEQVWAMRHDISTNFRNSLPRLLSCVRWNVHSDVAQMQTLLQSWPDVSTDTALELLDCMYPDQYVRHFAVKHLKESISDSELCRYLLQLVQALKFESYLDCPLIEFLLERAIMNRKLGHYLFWLLKSEMHVPSVSVRFGLILEAYCNISTRHVAILVKQNDAVGKMLALNRLVKSENDKATGQQALRKILYEYQQTDSMSLKSSPLNPALTLSALKVEKCKVMVSKMRPLWLVWENADKFGDDIMVIFKNGDDLRQDMLTLQILHIMDNIWISQGLDLRMNVYECLPTGRNAGLLEVVQKAETISKIQLRYSKSNIRSAFNRESLFKWLQEKNPNPEALQKAIEEFMLSCAGACVASYVLGIGDRHNDNIMLRETGQLFHIDFGHFLGNFKSKFGIRRERVPFVLTHDFMFVISKNTRTSKPFDVFQELCERAYMLLRKKGNLLISLFVMMVSTGIPELRSVSDLKYLQDTLKLDLPDDQALKHFKSKYKEALNNSWKTSVNWAFHNYANNS